MSYNNFDEVLNSLSGVQDSSKLLKLLIEVRKKVDGDKNKNKEIIAKIREKGTFKQIISSLQTSKKGIINISLSILGNCCLDTKCARDVISQYGILSNLNHLLKRYPKDDSINGRVFRIVGNLCQHKDQWSNVIIEKKPQIVIHIVKCLKDSVEEEGKTSEATVTMGIRSLRELLNRETLEPLVKTYEALKTVGMLLIKYGGVWHETRENEGILINIIKLLHEYSRYRYYPSILQMRNTDKGDSLIYLGKILLVSPRQVVKIVMSFLKMSQLKSDLPIPEIFNSFIEVLRDETLIQEFSPTCEECIKCLCFLFNHPGNRENERCGDSIPLLISILKSLNFQTNNKIECCLLIVSTLNKCRYNNSLIAEQIDCSAISVLDDKLKLIVGNLDQNIVHKNEKKRKSDLFAKLLGAKRSRLSIPCDNEDESSSWSSSDEEVDQLYSGSVRYDYSPSSSNESDMAMSWTSGLSVQSSPWSHTYGVSESDSDDYSPVCSEADPADFPLPTPEEDDYTNLETKSSDGIPEEVEELPSFDVDSTTVKEIKTKLLIEIVDLLKTYAKIRPLVAQLGTPELLLGLIKSSGYFDEKRFSAVLDIVDVVYRILESHDYLLPLMQSDFIPAVYDLTKLQHGSSCSKCRQFQWVCGSIMKKMSKVAESGGGKGDIAHKLLRGDSATKQQLVLVIPYVIRNKAILVKLMLNCGGLEILMKLLQERTPLQNKSIKVLCVLASKKLGIPNPKNVTNTYQTNVTERDTRDSPTLVTFKLDDGTLLSADRVLLSKNSDFFARLLNGDFKESSQDVITLPNVTNRALTYLLRFMQRDRVDLMVPDLDLSTHLDVIVLCDRFLMEEHRVYLTDCVEKYRLGSDTIPTIYNWSLESGTNLLRVECIAYALVGNIVDSERFEMFKNLFDLGYTEELVEDIRKLLVRYMSLSQWCDCKKKKGRHCDKNIHSIY